MPIFRIEGSNSLVLVKETPFAKEGRIQDLAEQNLEQVFGLQFVRRKFRVGGREIDTLAYDRDTKSFAIIEYKKEENFGMMDQGGTYLNILLENQAEFVLE